MTDQPVAGEPIRRDTVINRAGLTRRRDTIPGLIGGAITRLLYEVAAQVEPDPAVDLAWDSVRVETMDDPERSAIRIRIRVDLVELPPPPSLEEARHGR